jgi:hypothetical protein
MIIVSYVQPSDRWIRSDSSSYASALNGSNLQINEDSIGVYGQTYASSTNTRYIRQYFVEFPYTLPSGQLPVSGFWAIRNNVTHGTNVYRRMEVLAYDWGGTVTTGNWRTPSQLQSLELQGDLLQVNENPNDRWTYTGVRKITGHLFDDGAKRYVIVTNKNRVQTSPSQPEYNSVHSSRTANSANRPHMVIGTTTTNALSGILAAQIQLSDGTWIVLERTNTTREFQLRVIHRTLSSDTVVWESPLSTELTGNDNILGSHSYSLCRDNQDNFFIMDASWTRTDVQQITPFRKSGNTWTRVSPFTIKNPDESGHANIQATACTWHNVGSGRIVTFYVTDWGRAVDGAQGAWTILDAGVLLSGSGNPKLASETLGYGGVIAFPPLAGRNNAVNGTGTLFDAQTDPDEPFSGYLISGERDSILGVTGPLSVGHYRLSNNGHTLNSYTRALMDNSGGYSVFDPDAKARVICLGSGDIVKITADDRPEMGLTLDRWNIQVTGNLMTKVSSIRLDVESVPDLPDGAALGATPLWDAVHFSPDNNIWLYYFDDTDDRRLLRTAVSMSDDLALQNSVEVSNAVGSSSGDTVHSIRVQRNRLVSDNVLITVALEDSGGNHYYEYIVDRINIPPTQPILDATDNFDATSDQEFSWTFRDPNLSDQQSAYQLQIIRVADSTVEYDSGKVVSSNESMTLSGGSIANNVDYYWQVRTWDVDDAVSPWSVQDAFSTSDTGVVDITDPSADNLEGIFTINYLVKWSLTGATQEEYRLKLIKVSDSTVHTDTGWVTSSVQEHLVTGMISDVEYRIEVTTRNNLVESNTATRLITTHYDTPEGPIVSVSVTSGLEYATVSVINPEPRGDRPNPTVNQIFRRPVDSGDRFLMVGTCPPNSSFRDYTVASGLQYEYKVRAGVDQGTGPEDLESFTDSIVVFSDTVHFSGLWLHFPEDPQATTTNFLYGRDVRSYDINVGGKQLVLAGRKFGVTEFGEHQEDAFKVTVIVPHGPEYESQRIELREFASSKRTVVARDNRGVVMHGSISSLTENHESQGSSFSFDVNRVHREEYRVD